MSKYSANYYSGANTSIMIGNQVLTQAFGISWQVSQNKRPIYGYNSQYFDGIADGQVIVMGQLFVNFVHPGYLSELLRNYFVFRNAIESISPISGRTDDLLSYVQATEETAALASLIREFIDQPLKVNGNTTYTPIGAVNLYNSPENTLDYAVRPEDEEDANVNPQSPVRQRISRYRQTSEVQRSLDSALDYVFSNEDVRQDMIRFMTGGTVSAEYQDGDAASVRMASNASIIERNMSYTSAANPLAVFARPDQFTGSANGFRGIDIVVAFGAPYANIIQNSVINYSASSSFILRDVHFHGESGQIMSDGRPLLETYNYMARKKELITLHGE